MQKILMILTKDRRDCVDINLHLHERGGSFDVFDNVVFLLNDVTTRHMCYIDKWIARHPNVSCDKIIGDGTRPKGIADMQNRCIEKYPGAFYAKTDEDVFVPPGWARMMWEAYLAHRDREDLALITPLLPNNSYGLYILLNHYYPEHMEEHRRRFNRDPSPERASYTWHSPVVAEWATRKFINLAIANDEQRSRLNAQSTPDQVNAKYFHHFSLPFSIGCIAYDYQHISKMGGIPDTDEPGWCAWIEQNKQINILDCRQIALHYTFFVQQQWLDRTTLLEDIRDENIADTATLFMRCGAERITRLTRQLPDIINRKIKASFT